MANILSKLQSPTGIGAGLGAGAGGLAAYLASKNDDPKESHFWRNAALLGGGAALGGIAGNYFGGQQA